MLVKYLPPLVAVGMLGFAGYHVLRSQTERPPSTPPIAPPAPSFAHGLAATGTVEANTGNLKIAAPQPGTVAEVMVTVGQDVTAGCPLFRLDDRALQAELRVRQARAGVARSQLRRLEQLPRPDELPVVAARVREARAVVAERNSVFARGQKLVMDKLIDADEFERRKQALIAADEQLRRAEAEDALLRAGTWGPDREIAAAQVAEAEAMIDQIKTDLDRQVVRAPVAGTILQVNIRAGEAVTGLTDSRPVVLGNVTPLHVRIELDEQQLNRYQPGAAARAVCRGQTGPVFGLKFVRVEPLLVGRRTLNGDLTERADSRVLPVIYALDAGPDTVRVGQQLEVFLAATPRPAP